MNPENGEYVLGCIKEIRGANTRRAHETAPFERTAQAFGWMKGLMAYSIFGLLDGWMNGNESCLRFECGRPFVAANVKG